MNRSDYYQTPDGSVVTAQGDVVFFSIDRFKRDICEGDCCFICGARSGTTAFNDEHVIPEWVLRESSLFSKTISLPNGNTFRYDRYKIPCCARCNALLGERVEQPFSTVLKGGMHALGEHLRTNGPWLPFTWLALLFIKTHLRDREFRWHLDARQGAFPISEAYDWEALHHVHCIARSFFTRPELDATALGTFFALPASIAPQFEQFDYGDLYFHKTICFRFRDVAMVCVLNDSCACYSIEKDKLLPRISGPLSPLQIREVMARLGYLNLLIKERPLFQSEFDGPKYRISGTHPAAIELDEWNPEAYGRVLHHACAGHLDRCTNPDIEEIRKYVREGRYTFLFDQNGSFIKEQMVFVPNGGKV